MDLHCIASVLSTVPLATLDHFREGTVLRCILPLPQPASVSEADNTLRNLVETAQNFYHVQHLWKEAGKKVWERLVVAGVNSGTQSGKAQHFRPAQQAAMDKIEQYVSWFLKTITSRR